jgi:hypothetical protein
MSDYKIFMQMEIYHAILNNMIQILTPVTGKVANEGVVWHTIKTLLLGGDSVNFTL